jgi:hypothetical protein
MDAVLRPPRGLKRVMLSAIAGLSAPLVFVSIIVLRRADRRMKVHYRHWDRRLKHEIARWS